MLKNPKHRRTGALQNASAAAPVYGRRSRLPPAKRKTFELNFRDELLGCQGRQTRGDSLAILILS
jgi:hypothetical protein